MPLEDWWFNLSIRIVVLTLLKFREIQQISFPKEQVYPDLFKQETKIKFRLKDGSTIVFSNSK